MNLLQALICAYPQWLDGAFVDVTGQDFVDHLSIGAFFTLAVMPSPLFQRRRKFPRRLLLL